MLALLARFHGQQQQQPPRGLARFHAPGAFPSAGKKACAELTAQTEVALYLAHPAGETAGIGECRPQVVDIGVVAVLHAHDALAICRSQAAQDAGTRTCIASHLVLPSFAFPRATSVCRASSRCSLKANQEA